MGVNPKTLVEKFIKDSKGRNRLAAITSVLAVFTVLITVGVLTFPAISVSGSEDALREQGIDITAGQANEAQEVVAPPADEAPIVAYDGASQAPGAESNENVAKAITEETQIGDVVVSESEAEIEAGAPAEDKAPKAEEVDPSKEEAEKEIKASAEAKAALDAADLSSQRLIVGSEDATTLAEDANLVASFDNVYLLQYASVEEAAKGFLTYFDAADYVTPDVAVEIAEGEDNSDPEEEIITTDAVYTEEENPFVELEAAIVENEAEIAAEAKKQDALVALIDTGAKAEGNVVEAVSMLGENAEDENGHGERMVRYIAEENENARILSIKALGKDGKGDVSALIAAINYASERGANIINLSASAYASEENAALAQAIKAAEEAGIIVIGAAGNNGFNAKYYIPGNIEEAAIVGACDEQGLRIKQSNFGETVDYNIVAGSTSEAAARLSGFVSANGEEAIADALNQGLIFTTDYVAPEAEEEAVEEGEEAQPQTEDGKFTAQAPAAVVSKLLGEWASHDYGELGNQSNANEEQKLWQEKRIIINKETKTAKVATWDALNVAIQDKDIDTIILDKSAFKANGEPHQQAGKQAHVLAAYYTIEVKHNVTIKAGTGDDAITAIYHDAQPSEGMTSYFKVTEGATLTLDGVTLSGKQAWTAHAPVASELGRVELVPNTSGDYEGLYEIKLYDKDGKVHWLDNLATTENGGKLVEGIKSVIAVAPGTIDGAPVPGQPFTIREKEKTNGKYRFLAVENGKLWLKEISPDEVESTIIKVTGQQTVYDEDGNAVTEDITEIDGRYMWQLAETPASFLYNNTGTGTQGVAIIHDGYFDSKNWRNTPPRLHVTTRDFRVQTTDVPYTISSTTDAYFVQVEDGTVNVNNSTLEYARGGKAPIYANGSTAAVNIIGKTNIRYNRALKSEELRSHGWGETEASVWRAWGLPNRNTVLSAARGNWESAGAVYADNGATVTIGSVEVNNAAGAPIISSNHGQTGAIRAKGGATVTQYQSTIGGLNQIDGNVGARGGAVHISDTGTTYNMHTGSMQNNFAIEDGGAIRVDNNATFNMGYFEQNKPVSEKAPVIANNEAHYGAGGGILVESDNVNLYNGEIKNNLTYKMGGGIYVVGDSMNNTSKLTFKNWYGDTNSFVYDNYAFVGHYWDSGNWLDGDGGGLWFCNWGSYLYEENYLEIFSNKAGVDKNTHEYVAGRGNGDDFSKQGSKKGKGQQGLGAGFVNTHEWKFDRPDKTSGDPGYAHSIYNDGSTLDSTTVFPTQLDMNLKNSFTMSDEQKNGLDSKVRLIIHDNEAPLGGGIGCNGIIVFDDVPVHYKKIQAELALDKVWESNSNDITNTVTDKQLKVDIEIFNEKDNSVYKTYPSFVLDGSSKDTILVQDSKPETISRDGWHAVVDLPAFVFKIDQALLDAGITNAQRIDRNDHTAVDAAAANITSGDDGRAELNYGEPASNKLFTVDGKTGTISFQNWGIRITETILDDAGNVSADATSYILSMDDLYYEQLGTDKYVDTGHYFYLYTDNYKLSTKLYNNKPGVKINKVDESGNSLPGAGFSIISNDSKWPSGGAVAMVENGNVFTHEGLRPGSPYSTIYIISETTTPEGYEPLGTPIPFMVGRDGKITVLTQNHSEASRVKASWNVNWNRLAELVSVVDDGLTIQVENKKNKREVMVEKVWVGDTDADHADKPVQVELIRNATDNAGDYQTVSGKVILNPGEANEQELSDPTSTITLNENGSGIWKAKWVDLPVDDYRIREVRIPGYDVSYQRTEDADGNVKYTITNTKLEVEDGKVHINVNKVWADGNDGVDSIIVHLLQDGIKIDEATLSAENNWSHTFSGPDGKGWPKFNGQQLYNYTVKEASDLADYTSSISDPISMEFSSAEASKVSGGWTFAYAPKSGYYGSNSGRAVEKVQASVQVTGKTDAIKKQLWTFENVEGYGLLLRNVYDRNRYLAFAWRDSGTNIKMHATVLTGNDGDGYNIWNYTSTPSWTFNSGHLSQVFTGKYNVDTCYVTNNIPTGTREATSAIYLELQKLVQETAANGTVKYKWETAQSLVPDDGSEYRFVIPETVTGSGENSQYYVDGEIAFCINEDKTFPNGAGYNRVLIDETTVSNYVGNGQNLSPEHAKRVYQLLKRAIYFGYGSDPTGIKGNLTNQQFAQVTQRVIWDLSNHRSDIQIKKNDNTIGDFTDDGEFYNSHFGRVKDYLDTTYPVNKHHDWANGCTGEMFDAFKALYKKVYSTDADALINDIPLYIYVPAEGSNRQNLLCIDTIKGMSYQYFTITNTPNFQKRCLAVYKYDKDTNLPISGVEFSLYVVDEMVNSDIPGTEVKGMLLDTYITNENGVLTTKKNLRKGRTYYLVENTPSGYKPLTNGPIVFTLDGTDENITNIEWAGSQINFTETALSGTTQVGSTELNFGDITDCAGVIRVANEQNRYEFELFKVAAKNVNDIEVSNLGTQVDSGIGLEGAEFTLKYVTQGSAYTDKYAPAKANANWSTSVNADVKFKTDAQGKIVFSELPAGDYVLEEIAFPKEYVKPSTTPAWAVTIANDGTITIGTKPADSVAPSNLLIGTSTSTLVVGNHPQTYILPATGGVGTHVFAIIGGLLMLVAGALWVRRTGRQGT